MSPKKLPQHLGALCRGGDVEVFVLINQRAHPINAGALADGAANAVDYFVNALKRNGARVDGRTTGRLFAQDRHVHVAEIRQHERARDGRCRHHQHIDSGALFAERQTLVHAKAVLLVHDGEPQIGKHNALLKKRMGTDDNVDVTGGQSRQGRFAFRRFVASCKQRQPQAYSFAQRPKTFVMLAGKDFRRRHKRRLPPGLHHMRHRQQRDDCLA